MRKIFFPAVFATLMLGACSDAYDIHQPGVVTEEAAAFRTVDDINKGIRAVYSAFPGETEISFTSYFTDELGVGINNGGQGVNDGRYTFLLQPGTGSAQAVWGSYYGAVNRLNRIEHRIFEMEVEIEARLQEVDEFSNERYDLEDQLEKLTGNKAHLYALRAFCHYKLFTYFTPDYTDPNGLSVIKFDFLQTDDYERFEERSSVAEIVEFIESDIEKVREFGGVNNANLGLGFDTGFASDAFVEAILIKLYSMLQTPQAYEELEHAFNRLRAAPNNKGLSFGDYQSLFTGTPSDVSEGIFKLNRTPTDGTVQSGIASAWYADEVGGTTYMEIGRSLYNELDRLDPQQQGSAYSYRADERYNIAVFSGSDIFTGGEVNGTFHADYTTLNSNEFRALDILYIGKYTGIQARPLMNNVWVFRFTDMLLALAEKRAYEGRLSGTVALNDFSNVESIIYNIRAHRNNSGTTAPVTMPTNFSSQQEAYARILEERRVEFAFEGHRYLDMKRLGVKAGSLGFVRDPQDCISTGACLLDPANHRLTLPIPNSEIVANPRIAGQQNPGY